MKGAKNQVQIEELNLDVRTYNQVKRAGITSTEELLDKLYQPESVRGFPPRTMLRIEQALKAAGAAKYVRGDYITEADIDPQPLSWEALHGMCGKLVARDISTESRRLFRVCWIYKFSEDDARIIFQFNGNNYANAADDGGFYALKSEPDAVPEPVIVSAEYTRAVTLTKSIIAHAQAMQASLWEVCKGLKEMRDGKLYKEIGYSTFEDYCEQEIGIKRRQGQKYIAIAEMGENAQSTAQIGAEKMYLLSRLDEDQREELTQTVDLESTTVRELREQIAALKEASDLDRKERDNANEAAQRWKHTAQSAQADNQRLEDRVQSLTDQVRELESRPTDVAVMDNDEELKMLAEEIDALREENAKLQAKSAESAAAGGRKDVYTVLRNIVNDGLSRIDDYLRQSGDIGCRRNAAEMLRKYLEKWKG